VNTIKDILPPLNYLLAHFFAHIVFLVYQAIKIK